MGSNDLKKAQLTARLRSLIVWWHHWPYSRGAAIVGRGISTPSVSVKEEEKVGEKKEKSTLVSSLRAARARKHSFEVTLNPFFYCWVEKTL